MMKKPLSIFGLILTGTIFLIMSCGGGGGGGGGVSSALTNSNATAVAGVTLSSMRLLVDTSYLGSASVERGSSQTQGFLQAILRESLLSTKNISGRGIAAFEDKTEACSGGGTKRVVSEWSGDAASTRDVKSKVTYSSCREGSETWDGILEINIQGLQSMPEAVSTVATLTYSDAIEGDILTLTGAKVLYSNFIYKDNIASGARVELTGRMSGMVKGKKLSAEYDSFRMSYALAGPDVVLTLEGTINPDCISRWISVSTVETVRFDLGNRCPSSGKVALTEGNSTYVLSFEGFSGVKILYNGNQITSFAICNDIEGICTDIK